MNLALLHLVIDVAGTFAVVGAVWIVAVLVGADARLPPWRTDDGRA